MKRFAPNLGAFLFVASLAIAAPRGKKFTGEITETIHVERVVPASYCLF